MASNVIYIKKLRKSLEEKFYFANLYHSWERGLNENTNGLINNYLPKRKSMSQFTQKDSNEIADKLNRRPHNTLGYITPDQCYTL